MGEFSFLDEGRESEECDCTVGDQHSIDGVQPTIEWGEEEEDGDDVISAIQDKETEKCAEVEYLNKDGDVLGARSYQLREQKKLVYRIGKTVAMVVAPAVMALFLELAGPTLLDLMVQTNSNFEEISRVLVARSVGILFGSLIGGILTDKFPSIPELFMSMSFTVGAIGTALVPWMKELSLLGLTFHIQGLAFGFFDVCNNHLCMKMWQDKASCPIHALHFGYGLGALIAPQLARPFVITERHNVQDDIALVTNATKYHNANIGRLPDDNKTDLTANLTSTEKYHSKIVIPYLTSAAIAVLFTVVFCLFYVFEKCLKSGMAISKPIGPPPKKLSRAEQKRERRFLSILNPGSCTEGDSIFGLQFFLVAFFLFFNAVGGEHGYTKFLFTYAREGPLEMSSDAAAMVNTLFWICFMAGRWVAIFASRVVHPRLMLVAQLTVVLISSAALCLWAGGTALVLWVFTGIFAAFLGPIMPAGISWCNRYVLMKGTAVAVVFLATGTGSIFYQWLIGYLFQYRGASSLMYVILGFAVFIASDFVALLAIVHKRRERFDQVITTEVDEKGNISIVVEAAEETKSEKATR